MLFAIYFGSMASPQNFKGGSPENFVAFVSEQTHKDAMLVFARDYHLPAKSFDFSNSSNAYDQINHGTPFTVLGGLDWLMHDAYVPEEWFPRLASPVTPSPRVSSASLDTLVTNKTVTWECQKMGLIQIKNLSKAKWSHPLEIYWMYAPMAVAIEAKNEPEKQFLVNLAKDLGGSLQMDNNSYSIVPDWSTLFTRFTKTTSDMVARDTKGPARMKLDRELWAACTQAMGPNYISEIMDAPNDEKTYTVDSQSPLASPILDYLRQLAQSEDGTRAGMRSPLNRMDTNYPAKVVIRQDGYIRVQVPVVNGRSRRVTYMNV